MLLTNILFRVTYLLSSISPVISGRPPDTPPLGYMSLPVCGGSSTYKKNNNFITIIQTSKKLEHQPRLAALTTRPQNWLMGMSTPVSMEEHGQSRS